MTVRTTGRRFAITALTLAAAIWLAAGTARAGTGCDESAERFQGLRICDEREVPATWQWVPQVPSYEDEEAELAKKLMEPGDKNRLYTPLTCRAYEIDTNRQTEAIVTMLVSPREAVESGLPPGQLATYTRDPKNLTLADPLIAEARGDEDAATWTPPSSRGWFARQVIEVKRFWDLSVDEDEAKALAVLLAKHTANEPDCAHGPEPVPYAGPVALGLLATAITGAGLRRSRRRPR